MFFIEFITNNIAINPAIKIGRILCENINLLNIYCFFMSEEKSRNNIETDDILDQEEKFTFKKFIKQSKITLISLLICVLLMVVGLVLYSVVLIDSVKTAGLWIMIIGVGLFLLTMIFGFQKIES